MQPVVLPRRSNAEVAPDLLRYAVVRRVDARATGRRVLSFRPSLDLCIRIAVLASALIAVRGMLLGSVKRLTPVVCGALLPMLLPVSALLKWPLPSTVRVRAAKPAVWLFALFGLLSALVTARTALQVIQGLQGEYLLG